MFRMTVEDVFAIRGRGVVLTGKVESGTLRPGETLSVNGSGSVPVVGIEAFRKSLAEANAGDNIGVLLGDVDKAAYQRGDVLTHAGGAEQSGVTVLA
jgi:elongation factor Tu